MVGSPLPNAIMHRRRSAGGNGANLLDFLGIEPCRSADAQVTIGEDFGRDKPNPVVHIGFHELWALTRPVGNLANAQGGMRQGRMGQILIAVLIRWRPSTRTA